MLISLIVAIDECGHIGKGGKLPWGRIPADLKRFKTITTGAGNNAIVMGRKTFFSIGKALPKRMNIVLTKDLTFCAEGIRIAHSLEEAVSLAALADAQELLFIGGEEVYRLAIPLAQKIYMTIVHRVFDGDVFFPLDAIRVPDCNWRIIFSSAIEPGDETEHPLEFIVYERR